MGKVLLKRRDVVAELLKDRGDTIVVTGLGSPSYDVMAAGDHDLNYYLWGAMGGAAMVGLGLAKSRPDHNVLVITGDGEMLMAMGAFATIAVQAPKNLTIAILDNGYYGETGMQLSHSGRGVELDRVAASVKFDWAARITDMAEVKDLRRRVHARNALNCAAISIDAEEVERVLPSRDGVYIKNRVKAALGQKI
ncbi:thiamine pyrophosphate-dependent enzyme [Sneathiella marina]|uniref:Thiamine pyrophosphate-dependent enzyme n=1 Tax=Sneathiella marina TaxID=2950108 RepID=A0ABY4W6L6_9PROT|nr:thiamine pyrophosphate-dependent enzyme [Sneathiella marina]USG62574.1 thiamine pyrophosphate-dependent enzyme [Sneathiella marina]